MGKRIVLRSTRERMDRQGKFDELGFASLGSVDQNSGKTNSIDTRQVESSHDGKHLAIA